jgi:flagellin-like hook-associated protein FlgL
MSKIINAILIGLLGGGCFAAGIYYATLEFENELDVWDSNYQIITDKVYSFEKVSDPKTIRLYVKELNKILDDVTFLGKIVESGQVSAGSLDEFFSEYQDKIDEANDMIFGLHSELTGLEYKLKEQVTRLTGETDGNLESIQEIQDRIQKQIDYVNKLNVDIGQSINNLEDDIQTIKSSKYGSKIWKIKK